MNKSNESARGGVGLFSLIFVVFLTLKLCGVIDWSWWWVTAPLWGPLAFGLVVVTILVVVAGLVALVDTD